MTKQELKEENERLQEQVTGLEKVIEDVRDALGIHDKSQVVYLGDEVRKVVASERTLFETKNELETRLLELEARFNKADKDVETLTAEIVDMGGQNDVHESDVPEVGSTIIDGKQQEWWVVRRSMKSDVDVMLMSKDFKKSRWFNYEQNDHQRVPKPKDVLCDMGFAAMELLNDMVPVATIEAALKDNEFCQREHIKSKSLLERIGYLVTHANEYHELQGIILMMEPNWGFDGNILARAKDMVETYKAQKAKIAEASNIGRKLKAHLGLKPSATEDEMLIRAERRETFHHEVWAIAGMKPGHDHTLYSVLKGAMESDREFKKMSEQVAHYDQRRMDLEEQLEDAAERVERAFAMAGRALVMGG